MSYYPFKGFKVNIDPNGRENFRIVSGWTATTYSYRNTEIDANERTYDPSVYSSDNVGTRYNENNNTVNIYYLRNKYSITFQQGNTVIGSDEYYYEANISNADKYSSAVNVPAGMRFVGWYDNPEGLGEKYTFDGKTMPSNNLILYAKLVPEEYYVRLDYNGGETKGSESTFAWVEYGDTVEEAEDAACSAAPAGDFCRTVSRHAVLFVDSRLRSRLRTESQT